uniref:Uncharacterized protein n=1 Tax=Anguilla anguilla TaxID=7936 RepID=A0A0E9VF71_ANGAN
MMMCTTVCYLCAVGSQIEADSP